MLAWEPNLNKKDIDGNTPLHLAAKKGNMQVFQWLWNHPDTGTGSRHLSLVNVIANNGMTFAEGQSVIGSGTGLISSANLDLFLYKGKPPVSSVLSGQLAKYSGEIIYHENIKSLFSVSDILAINCPATKETVNIINKETLEYFPTGAIITNSARGDMIDDEAMLDALDRRKIYAVGLDVYKGEPNLNSGYLKHKSAFILPHLGSSTKQTRTAMGDLAVDNIDEFLKTGNCKNKVN